MEFYQEVEKALATTDYKRIYRPFMAAIKEYRLIEDGDRIAVCLSGGKDSMLLAKCMQEFKRHTPLTIELSFICMDPGYTAENRLRIEENARLLHIPVSFFATDIFADVAQMGGKPCAMCAKMRRGYLYRHAQSLGCNKIALGHHFDDAVETLMMSMLYAGQLRGMNPYIPSENVPGMALIRPLYKVHEADICFWRERWGLQFLDCACAVARDGIGTSSKRAEVKRLIAELNAQHPDAARNIFRSAHNVDLNALIAWKQGKERHSFLDELPIDSE